MVFEKETKKSMVYEIYEHFFVVYEIFAVHLNIQICFSRKHLDLSVSSRVLFPLCHFEGMRMDALFPIRRRFSRMTK
jgi:hypothetical protein